MSAPNRRVLLGLAAASHLVLILACGISGPGASAFTDSSANRTQAMVAASGYLETHRAELIGASATWAADGRISGGRLEGASERAFEVRFSVLGDPRIVELVAYVFHSEDAFEVAGAQARDSYGAVVHDLGAHLDRRFFSRD